MLAQLIYNELIGKFEADYPFTGVKNPLVSESGAQTLTNKTLTSPTLTTPTITGAQAYGAITTDVADAAVAVTSGITVFTKGSASTHTLAAPATIGALIELYAGSAQAHVITATGLIDDGVTGGSKTTLTLGSFIGASVVLRCVQAGKWAVHSKNVCTIT